ncbi:uncharacterized protein LOC131634589 [Vicia villosa]|uniref:uncharacterized protein LOC131634589 n=1 Tax=Vicia villosa TaxID=3911 RepID=UPI00273C0094|nr:uncharacterized protein LOC131634589 [Vicia villosa]
MELVDLPTIGGKFTWIKSNGKSMSRIDRFLLSDDLVEDWKVEGQYIRERDVSDHAPIWLEDNRKNWGPKPFKFNNLWFKHDDFETFVKEEWKKIEIRGIGDYCLVEKLKTLKNRLLWWNKNVYGWIDLKINEDGREMHSLDNVFAHFADSLEGRLEGVDDIKEYTFKHFEKFFKEDCTSRPELRGINFNSLTLEESTDLEKPFDEDEVKEAIWSCDGNKSPGPDGFSLEFYKRHWSIIKEDIMKCCNDFYHKGTLVKSITSSFLALIPKKKNPQDLFEYRPICLVGSIYKIIAKLLANRMRGVVDLLVSTNQTAFVPGRSMMDGVVMVNEILDWAKRKKKGCLLLKVDFEKAYDSVSWNYLRWILVKMGFGKRWMKWMEASIFTNFMSVMVNGSATREFKVQRGLRQGDPISPFLFVLAMEGLTALTKKSVAVGDFKPFKYGANDYVDILQFADDTIILGEPSYDNLWSIKVLLRGFELVSELKVNFHKSNFYGTHIGDWFINSATKFLACKKGCFPFKFLGIWVGEGANKKKVWQEVIGKIKSRLSNWKGRNISMGGRVTLIGSILNAIPIFTLSFYKAPSFNEWVKCEFKRGNNILFWLSCWLVDQPLRVVFPHLFDKTTNKLSVVSDLFLTNQGEIIWNLEDIFGEDVLNPPARSASSNIASNPNTVITEELRELKRMLHGMVSDSTSMDGFHWNLNTNGAFTVSSVSHLVSNAKEIAWPNHIIKSLDVIWKTNLPAKIKIFAWRFLLNRLPLKDQLVKRGVTTLSSLVCLFCTNLPETLDHLFFHFHVTKEVWSRIYVWLGNALNFSLEEFKNFGSIQEKVKNKNIKANLNNIWIALIWCIWNMRNNMIFDEESLHVSESKEIVSLSAKQKIRVFEDLKVASL